MVNDEKIRISPDSPAFRYGQGFFTTTRIVRGIALWLDEHIERLNKSLLDFNFPQLDSKKIKNASIKWAKLSDIDYGIVRILVWPENDGLSYHINGGPLSPTIKPLKLTKASFQRHSSEVIYRYKSFNYWQNLLAYQEAQTAGYDDSIIANELGEICETSRHNVFWIKNDIVYTPDLVCNLLNGIMREKIINIINSSGMELREVRANCDELKKAETIFVTNSVRGIVLIEKVNTQTYKLENKIVQFLNLELKNNIEEYCNSLLD